MFTDTANRKYTIKTVACWAGYLVIGAVAARSSSEDWGHIASIALSAAVAIPVAAHVWATWVLVNEADEFARAVVMKRFVISWGICLVLASAWGFAETFVDLVHAPGQVLYPLFWIVFGVASLFVNASR